MVVDKLIFLWNRYNKYDFDLLKIPNVGSCVCTWVETVVDLVAILLIQRFNCMYIIDNI